MNSGRLEAFSDGVIAIIITIMVLELTVVAPTVLYGLVLLMAAVAYWMLQQLIIAAQGPDSLLKKAVGSDWKGKASTVLYLSGIAAVFRSPWLAQLLYVLVALLWFVPDRRIENVLVR
jgi:uncharacterized membrane protein